MHLFLMKSNVACFVPLGFLTVEKASMTEFFANSLYFPPLY